MLMHSMGTGKRLGILTSGGDAPGLNAAMRALARTAISRYGMEVIGIEQGYRGLSENKWSIITEQNFSGILARGGTILGTSREKPFKDTNWRSGEGGGMVARIKKNYADLHLDCLVVIGGNGSLTTAALLAQEGLHVIGIPKTIDNDIAHNDMSLGFHTALDIAVHAIDRLHTTAESHSRIMVIELMGHKAGWLALYAGIAGGSDIIIIPELPYNIAVIAEHLKKRQEQGKHFSVVAIAEGALSSEEKNMDKKVLKESRKMMAGSIGCRVAREIEAVTGSEARLTVLGYVQRGGTPSGYDRILATRFGAAAAAFAAEECYGVATVLQAGLIKPVPLSKISDKVKKVPKDHPMIRAARDIGTCFAD